MSKLTRKLVVRITFALCAVFILSFAVNTYFLPKYVLYQEKQKLTRLTSELAPLESDSLIGRIAHIEMQYQVTITHTILKQSINDLNSDLMVQLNRKGIALSKFWLGEESITTLREGRRVNQIYDQSKLKSSFLVNFLPVGGSVFAIGESISHSSDTIRMVNRFNAYLWLGMLLFLILLSALFTSRIVKPLGKLNDTAEAIARLSFTKADIRTGDEIETLANSINRMSDRLEEAQQSMEAKNENLRTFIANISHELKTPLSLIRVYASGLQDHLDDGTYAGVILQQSKEMTILIDRLLELSRLQAESYHLAPVDMLQLWSELYDVYKSAFREQGLELVVAVSMLVEAWVMADRWQLESVMHNWLTNAMKYSTDSRVYVTISSDGTTIRFAVANRTDIPAEASWDQVWEPFFVMESSRSKKNSGTGLGLSITRAILLKHSADYGIHVQEESVEFYFSLPLLGRELGERSGRI